MANKCDAAASPANNTIKKTRPSKLLQLLGNTVMVDEKDVASQGIQSTHALPVMRLINGTSVIIGAVLERIMAQAVEEIRKQGTWNHLASMFMDGFNDFSHGAGDEKEEMSSAYPSTPKKCTWMHQAVEKFSRYAELEEEELDNVKKLAWDLLQECMRLALAAQEENKEVNVKAAATTFLLGVKQILFPFSQVGHVLLTKRSKGKKSSTFML